MSLLKIIFLALILTAVGVIEASAVDQSICSSGVDVVVYPNGSIQSCILKDSLTLKDIKCKGQSPVSFYDTGQLEECILAESATISGQKCNEFGLISFYPDGRFRSCVKKD